MNRSLNIKEIAYAAMGIALIAVCSWISIPAVLSMVPFTLQTFAVCLIPALFGLRLGFWTVLSYILLGLAGAPVFAGFQGGPAALLGPTGGYIIGFLFTALPVGLASDRRGGDRATLLTAMALGIVLLYTFGTAWYVVVYMRNTGAIGVLTALGRCVFPYIIPDGIKITLAAMLAKRLRGFLKKELLT